MAKHISINNPSHEEEKSSSNGRAWFLSELELYQTVKPYRLRFDSPDPSIARTNIKNREANIEVFDLRKYSGPLSYEKSGFVIMEAQTALIAEDCKDEHTMNSYLQSLKPILGGLFRNAQVVILEYVIRKREESFPISHGGDYEHNQPVLVAHVDWTPQYVESRVKGFVGEKAATKILDGRYQYVHVWKPLKGPVKDWPLAVCDISSIDPDKDLERTDTVFNRGGEYEVQENYQMYHRHTHRWFYLSDQKTSELTVFRQYDSEVGHGSGVPHVAFPDPKVFNATELRESIEVQCLVYWDSEKAVHGK